MTYYSLYQYYDNEATCTSLSVTLQLVQEGACTHLLDSVKSDFCRIKISWMASGIATPKHHIKFRRVKFSRIEANLKKHENFTPRKLPAIR